MGFKGHVARRAFMSALGQKQTLERDRIMSALPPKADIETRSRDVRFVPEAEIAPPYSITSLARSITSLARSKIDVGISMPSAFVVRKLIAMSNFVGSKQVDRRAFHL
jgi:hypothetical protein